MILNASINMNSAKSCIGFTVNLHLTDGDVIPFVKITKVEKDPDTLVYKNKRRNVSLPLGNVAYITPVSMLAMLEAT